METTTLDSIWIRRAKKLTLLLCGSVFVNVALGLSLFSQWVTDRDPAQFFEKTHQKGAVSDDLQVHRTLSKTLSKLSIAPFSELINELSNRDPIEQGYRLCDLALSCLVSYHHFDLHKALGGGKPQSRDVTFARVESGETIDIALFPGLTEAQLQAICHFARTEEWPLTSQGLFLELKQRKAPPSSLIESFTSTPEFQALYLYLQRAPRAISRIALTDLLLTADYDQFEKYASKVRKDPLLTSDFRFQFYRAYLVAPSKIAAYMLLENDEKMCLEQLPDREIHVWLQLIDPNHPKFSSICHQLLTSPRTDDVWHQSAFGLLKAKNLPVPSPYNHGEALRLLFPEATWKAHNVVPPSDLKANETLMPDTRVVELIPEKWSKPDTREEYPLSTTSFTLPISATRVSGSKSDTRAPDSRVKAMQLFHTVQEGESLWKISRKYKVSVESLMEINRLDSEKLVPGKVLQIPR